MDHYKFEIREYDKNWKHVATTHAGKLECADRIARDSVYCHVKIIEHGVDLERTNIYNENGD